jgi:F0F1-type ATP synthase alpha subunit
VVTLYAIQQGYTAAVAPEQLGAFLGGAWQHVQEHAAAALAEVADTKQLTATAERGIAEALEAYSRQAAAAVAG